MANMHPGGLDATRQLAAWAGVGPGTRVLDVGCGVGQTACLLAGAYRADVVGLDRSARMVARARERAGRRGLLRVSDAGTGATFLEGDAYALPFDEGSFDVVFAESVTLFLDRSRVLPELRRVLVPGGRVADVVMTCHDPVPEDVLDRFARLEGVRMQPLSAAGWTEAYGAAGFEIERADFHPSLSDGATVSTFFRDNGLAGLRAAARLAGLWLADPAVRAYVRDGSATWREHRHRFGFGLIVARRP
ncbi:MAG: class I SAM-dependent methyltransferase [Candidatus Sericytochromatia bacterium]|nr:class I SAM-dependent methyltransferase [Candidatus Tanganyikabacteria bacterium]